MTYLLFDKIVFLVCLSFIIAFLPESPTWLLSRQKDVKAERSKKWLKLERNTPTLVELMSLKSETEAVDYKPR